MTSERTEKLAAINHWNELIALRERHRARRQSAVQVVQLSGLPLAPREPVP